MEFTKKEMESFCKKLEDNGYTRYNSCLVSTEDFGYFKSFAITKDEYGNKNAGYQIEFAFYDWTKYQKENILDFGLCVNVIQSSDNRNDLVLTRNEYDISEIEKVAEDFYQFIKQHNLQ